jgi:hypothetical protein
VALSSNVVAEELIAGCSPRRCRQNEIEVAQLADSGEAPSEKVRCRLLFQGRRREEHRAKAG